MFKIQMHMVSSKMCLTLYIFFILETSTHHFYIDFDSLSHYEQKRYLLGHPVRKRSHRWKQMTTFSVPYDAGRFFISASGQKPRRYVNKNGPYNDTQR